MSDECIVVTIQDPHTGSVDAECTLAEFIRDNPRDENPDLYPEVIERLRRGESAYIGGGAAAQFLLVPWVMIG
jgi:hypothetical protein